MSTIEPTEEQKQAAFDASDKHGWRAVCKVIDVARLLAEREAKLRDKIDALERSEHDVHVAIYECLVRAPAMGVRLHIDGEPDRMARDVVDWVKAATKVLEGRDVVSLATFHRVEAERDTLRARVAELEASRDHPRTWAAVEAREAQHLARIAELETVYESYREARARIAEMEEANVLLQRAYSRTVIGAVRKVLE